MISPVPAECSAGTKYKKEYWKDIQDKKTRKVLQQSIRITAGIATKYYSRE
jgi:hypothetical protein